MRIIKNDKVFASDVPKNSNTRPFFASNFATGIIQTQVKFSLCRFLFFKLSIVAHKRKSDQTKETRRVCDDVKMCVMLSRIHEKLFAFSKNVF